MKFTEDDIKNLNYSTVKHNGLDWIVLKSDTMEKLGVIFEIILELYNNVY